MNNQSIYSEFGFLGFLLRFIDEHPVLTSIMLFLDVMALIYAVVFYDFTTRI